MSQLFLKSTHAAEYYDIHSQDSSNVTYKSNDGIANERYYCTITGYIAGQCELHNLYIFALL